jgi:uncharacterized membrane protein YraQ (UPF0718 family)
MIKELLGKIRMKWIFLIIVIILYLVLAFVDAVLAKTAFFEFIFLVKKVIPVLFLVFMLTFVFNLFLDPKKMKAFVGKSAGPQGWVVSIVGGILSSGPIYIWYPLLKDLKEREMKDGFIAAFLYARAVKIPYIPMMFYYFGIPFTIILSFYMVVFSILNGFLIEKLIKLIK